MILIITAALCAGLCGCAGQDMNEAVQPESEMTAEVTSEPEQEAVQPSLSDCALTHNPDTAGVLLDISIDDFNALGFAYGDSVDLKFSNGYELDDIPYYNGYYTAAYDPLLVAYSGSESVKAKFNYGDDLWEVADLSEYAEQYMLRIGVSEEIVKELKQILM